ncbi:MAG: pyridoxal 5'-phosphate synthase glutaminase subunit PdxT [Oscillospiraceae bacterium]|nr:pyridoxal 5'-phosphate synthase glutaminase subunit PdxT [Oscillospiraceae bacterium]
MDVGILALQGAFVEHAAVLERLGAGHFEIRNRAALERPMDGLILPGGESTVMGKLLRQLGLYEPLRARIAGGLPVFGTCAGLILLAERVEGGEPCFGTMDIQAVRNAYGRQLGSFHAVGSFDGRPIPMTFIRAPYIGAVGPKARVLAQVDGRVVAARQGNQLVTAFHPELDGDLTVHKLFLDMCREGADAARAAS